MSASVDGGPSGGSRMRRPGSEDPHWRQRKLVIIHYCMELSKLALVTILRELSNWSKWFGWQVQIMTEKDLTLRLFFAPNYSD